MNKPLGADAIDWDHPRPWGGGTADERSIRVYYGSAAFKAVCFPRLTTARPDVAWIFVDDTEPPESYDWSWVAGHEFWLWPVGFSTSPYSRALTKVLSENFCHRVFKVNGWDKDTVDLIESTETLVLDAGRAKRIYLHRFLDY